jgi:hypothetical protein
MLITYEQKVEIEIGGKKANSGIKKGLIFKFVLMANNFSLLTRYGIKTR